MTPTSTPATHHTPTKWGQIKRARWGQIRLTVPKVLVHVNGFNTINSPCGGTVTDNYAFTVIDDLVAGTSSTLGNVLNMDAKGGGILSTIRGRSSSARGAWLSTDLTMHSNRR
jgi:hypothetical protein